jgi:hypothetical protein
MSRSLVLFVKLEYELGDLTHILSLNPLPAGRSVSTRLHSAYNAIPAWMSLNALEVAVEARWWRLWRWGPMFWKVMIVQFFPGCGGKMSPKASLSLAARSSPCRVAWTRVLRLLRWKAFWCSLGLGSLHGLWVGSNGIWVSPVMVVCSRCWWVGAARRGAAVVGSRRLLLIVVIYSSLLHGGSCGCSVFC